jgi:hypothetical protein
MCDGVAKKSPPSSLIACAVARTVGNIGIRFPRHRVRHHFSAFSRAYPVCSTQTHSLWMRSPHQ